MLLGLLLIQPALCIIHCAAASAHSSDALARGTHNQLLCGLADDQAAENGHIPVPAFWPSLPATLLIILAPAILLLALPLLASLDWPTLSWSPPIPPPRHM